MALTVYGSSLSPFVRKTRVVLAEKSQAYELDQVNVFNPPDWFLEISPLKRIPVLRDSEAGENATLPDSSVICAYLERKFPEPSLYPADAFDYGRALWFEEYGDTALGPGIGMGVFRPRIVTPMMTKNPPDEEKVTEAMTKTLPPLFDYLEKEIGSREFLVGDSVSIADIAIATHFVNLAHAGESVDAGRWPNLAGYIERIHARPSFKACIDEEARIFKAA